MTNSLEKTTRMERPYFKRAEQFIPANIAKNHFVQLCLSPFLSFAMLLGLFFIMLAKPRAARALISHWVSTLVYQR
jgi:hypothetical protein